MSGTRSDEEIVDHSILSYKGTISKVKFIILSVLLFCVGLLLSVVIGVATDKEFFGVLLVTLLLYFCNFIIASLVLIKRSAALGVSPYNLFWIYIPFGIIGLFSYFIFAKPNEISNYSEKKAKRALIINAAVMVSIAVISFCSGYFDASSNATAASDSEQQTSETMTSRSPEKSSQERIETKKILVAGHSLEKNSVYKNDILKGAVTHYKDWLCVTCSYLDLQSAFSEEKLSDPEILFFVKVNKNKTSQNGYLTGYTLTVAKKNTYLRDALPGTNVKTTLDKYEVDCVNKKYRLLSTYFYSEYFDDSLPVDIVNWKGKWKVSQENDFYERALVEQTCRNW